jgi:hypothetical protein
VDRRVQHRRRGRPSSCTGGGEGGGRAEHRECHIHTYIHNNTSSVTAKMKEQLSSLEWSSLINPI